MIKDFTTPGPMREAPVAPDDQGGAYAPCGPCAGDGLVIDDRTGALADCPACDGMGEVWIDEAADAG